MHANHLRVLSTIATLSFGIWADAPAWVSAAHAATDAASVPAIKGFESLAKLDLARVDAKIISAAVTTRADHAFCDVKGYITPATQFEVLLPTTTWHGDDLQQGCGGFCGHVEIDLQDPSRTSGYQAPYAPLANGERVVAADDQGHETSSNGETLWGKERSSASPGVRALGRVRQPEPGRDADPHRREASGPACRGHGGLRGSPWRDQGSSRLHVRSIDPALQRRRQANLPHRRRDQGRAGGVPRTP